MRGTENCVYETPCGWCSKWDKNCDKKTPECEQITKCNPINDVTTNKICRSEYSPLHGEEKQFPAFHIDTA